MNTPVSEPNDPLDQAAVWIARLRADDTDIMDQRGFCSWLAARPENAAAFDRMLELWGDLGMLRVLPLDSAAAAAPRSWRIPMALAASLALIALLLFSRSTTPPALELRTAIGGFEQVRLEDGSELMLNTNTALRIQMDSDTRTAHMQRGEAFFRVEPDASRPFHAVCGNAAATVLGTAFNVRCDSDAMSVQVEQGSVRFGAWPDGAQTRLLLAGESSRYAPQNGLQPLEQDASAMAWTRRQLVFEDVALHAVVAQLQRYMEPTLRIVDPAAGAIRVSGVFGTEQPLQALRALEQSLGIHVEGPQQGPLLISRRSD